EDAIETLIKYLIPRATIVTPNIPESEILTGMKIESLDDMLEAARIIVEKHGAEVAIVKGGHLEGNESIDVLYYRGDYHYFRTKRIRTKNTHGTGCSFSAALAALLAKKHDILEAVETAKQFITTAIKYGLPLGKGHGPVNPAAWLIIPAEKYRVIETLWEAVKDFISIPGINDLIPEVGTNIVYSLPAFYARTTLDVAGVEGRITRGIEKPVIHGLIRFGASSHMARLVLAAQQYDPRIRAAANIRYDERLVRRAEEKGYSICYVDRRNEPEEIKKREGASIPWILGEAVRKTGRVPTIIYDRGDYAREPMIRILADNPLNIVKIIRDICRW
ncbi:MAG: bifunctional hydroxymethylpyrimidine kinase/phosphomethylpyrimidine kinase, partial [Crenarchaeota archaeon]|nr:bifunctional hydroxymethylpyrimidine kinase/phosphomethylpyrimidine kinase [Thermoproteota archaeon]